MKHIEASVDLPADPAVVWAQLVDTESIGTWNPFITSLSGTFEVGGRLRVRIAPVGGKPMTSKPRATAVDPGRRLEWLGTMGIPGLFDGRHSFTLTALEHGRTRRCRPRTSPAHSSRSPEPATQDAGGLRGNEQGAAGTPGKEPVRADTGGRPVDGREKTACRLLDATSRPEARSVLSPPNMHA